MTESAEETSEETTTRERLFHVSVDREPSESNVQRLGIDVQPVVFLLSLVLIAVVAALTIGLGNRAGAAYETVFDAVNRNFGWFYVLAVNIFILALVTFAVNSYGTIRLGGPDAEPEFSDFAWLSMLFTSGMGIGLLFFGVAEPMFHFLSGGGSFFDVAPRSPAAGRAATAITMFHWSLHPWAIYGIVGLALAFFSFNRGLPLSFRSVFYPIMGDRIFGWPGHMVDLAAVVATIFGLATMTGLGALQINAGLDFLAQTAVAIGLPMNVWTQIGIIALLTGVTTVSVLAGLDSGIRPLSKLNVVLMFLLLLFVFLTGPTVFLLDVFSSGIGAYLGNLPELSFYTEAFADAKAGWQHDWTIFFWGFWITWAPFVGLFIARISRGRTIRQFVGAILLLPTLFSVVWMAAFGGSAIFVELNVAGGGIVEPLQEHGRAVALFEMLAHYPFTLATSFVATATLVTFFITSADSGALATSYLVSGGKRETSRTQRAIWPILIGGTAATLLLGNGLDALQTAVITTGLPFSVLILLMVYTVFLGLRREVEIHNSEAYRQAVAERVEAESIKRGEPTRSPPDLGREE